jgi:branched-chain amino acid transport system permease protein
MYGIAEIFMALVLILILIFRPEGIFGTREPGFLVRKQGRLQA